MFKQVLFYFVLFLSLNCFAATKNTLLHTPIGSKIVFKQDITIPPTETSILLGKTVDSYITECHLYLKSYHNNIRVIPKGTEFVVKDTREGFANRVDLILESKSISSIACATEKAWRNDQPIPENFVTYTSLNQAERAFGSKLSLKVNKEPVLIKD